MLPIDSREYPVCRCVVCVSFIFDHTTPYVSPLVPRDPATPRLVVKRPITLAPAPLEAKDLDAVTLLGVFHRKILQRTTDNAETDPHKP